MNDLKYGELIDRCYKELNLIPINGQDVAVNRILVEFFDNDKKNVILSADTGTGKSIIATIVSLAMKIKFESRFTDNELLPATIAVHSNSLVNQYQNTFSRFHNKDIMQIMGSRNYSCDAGIELTDDTSEHTAENCFKKTASPEIKKMYCEHCRYDIDKSYLNRTNLLITNYSYHFISTMRSNHLTPRLLTIFDEAHTLNDTFCSNISIDVSVEQINRHMEICKEYPLNNRDNNRSLMEIRDDLMQGRITQGNYVGYTKRMFEIYVSMLKNFTVLLTGRGDGETLSKDENKEYMRLKKLESRYRENAKKIADLFEYKYDHVFDGTIEYQYSIKPIFISKFAKKIMSEYNLFMSATISDEYVYQTMDIDRSKSVFIELDTVYKKEAKQIMFLGNKELNYKNLKDPSVIKEIKETTNSILVGAVEDNMKGLILTSSYSMGDMFVDVIPKGMKLFHHRRGDNIDRLITSFKRYKGSAVLMSPSIYEGVDFADDYSRFQIIVKAPYQSLGDERIKYIAKNYPDVYRIMTIKKIIQGCGRSVRNKDDSAIMFILDKGIERLFYSPLNVWKKQFLVS